MPKVLVPIYNTRNSAVELDPGARTVLPGTNVSFSTNPETGDITISSFNSGGTVTSVGLSAPTGLSVAGSPVTGVGVLALSHSAGYQGYTSAEAIKLSGVATSATANATDASLRDRATHTGTQAVGTITGLATVATSGLKADVGLGNVDNTSDVNKPVSTAQAAALSDKVSASPGYLPGANANNTPVVWAGPIAAPSTGTPTGSWTDLISFGAGGDYHTQIARSWFGTSLYTRARTGSATYSAWNTIWDSGNFNPATKQDGAAASAANRLIFNTNQSSTIASAAGSLGQVEVHATNPNAAFMSFHRGGNFAAYFGLDNDNQFKVGGWSMGAVAHTLWHSGNFAPATKANLASPEFTGNGNPGGPAGYAVTTSGGYGGGYRMIDGDVQTGMWTQNDGTMRFGTGTSTSLGQRMMLSASGMTINGELNVAGSVAIGGLGQIVANDGYLRVAPPIRSYSVTRDQKASADLAVWVTVPRHFVQTTDPGAQAQDGDIWTNTA